MACLLSRACGKIIPLSQLQESLAPLKINSVEIARRLHRPFQILHLQEFKRVKMLPPFRPFTDMQKACRRPPMVECGKAVKLNLWLVPR
jgi:hypothetical protein